MKNFNTYIIEKLKIDKNTKVSKYQNAIEIIERILSEKLDKKKIEKYVHIIEEETKDYYGICVHIDEKLFDKNQPTEEALKWDISYPIMDALKEAGYKNFNSYKPQYGRIPNTYRILFKFFS